MKIDKMTIFLFFVFLMFVKSFRDAYASEDMSTDLEWKKLYYHKPMYVIAGKPDTKIQISLKIKVLTESSLYFAYTQKVFWDTFKKSGPISDINYNPSIFYRFANKNNPERLIDLIGFEHESNGKDGAMSRSWNRSGIRVKDYTTFNNGTKLSASAYGWVPYNVEKTNSDIANYRGTYELNFELSNFIDKDRALSDISLKIYPGGERHIDPIQGGRELTFRFRGSPLLTNAVFQIFQGYGEKMISYNKSIWGVRAGIGI